jgi:histidinol-phosphate/aromatic aminotransferase/cobyric acid decarboxylase-like protein
MGRAAAAQPMTTRPLPSPGRHGGDGAKLAAALGIPTSEVLDLSLSLNPSAPDIAAMVARHATSVRHYPDDTAARGTLAAAMSVDPERLVLTNGGAEAIALVAAQMPVGDVATPDFSLYEKHLATVRTGAPRWRSNPNNPTGRLAASGEIAEVWDEAFYPLATGTWTRGDARAVVVGSLTKVFACPGMRLGYVLAPTGALARAVAARQPEWSVNSLACAVVPELVESADLSLWARTIATRRGQLEAVLCDHGLEPDRSDANYLLVRHAVGVRNHLARGRVLVRDTSSFGLRNGVRIAVPDEAGLERFTLALEGWKP